jgi:hypothetical protein
LGSQLLRRRSEAHRLEPLPAPQHRLHDRVLPSGILISHRLGGWAKRNLRLQRVGKIAPADHLCRTILPTLPHLHFRSDADERVGSVDIDERGLAVNRHFHHRFAVQSDQVTRADIALNSHQIGKETP